MSPAFLIAKYLAANGVGLFPNPGGAPIGAGPWEIAFSREPASPDMAVTIYDTGGSEPDTDALDLLNPTFQVRVRGPKTAQGYADAYAKQEVIRDLLILPAPVVQGTAHFIGIAMTSDILSIGRDDNDRHLLTANYRAIKLRNAAENGG